MLGRAQKGLVIHHCDLRKLIEGTTFEGSGFIRLDAGACLEVAIGIGNCIGIRVGVIWGGWNKSIAMRRVNSK